MSLSSVSAAQTRLSEPQVPSPQESSESKFTCIRILPWRVPMPCGDHWICTVRQCLNCEEAHRRRKRCRIGGMVCMAGLLEEGRQGCVPGLSYDFFPFAYTIGLPEPERVGLQGYTIWHIRSGRAEYLGRSQSRDGSRLHPSRGAGARASCQCRLADEHFFCAFRMLQ